MKRTRCCGGPGYERWLKIHNLKEASRTLNYLTEHGITEYELLAARASDAAQQLDAVSASIRQYEHRMEEIARSTLRCWKKRKQLMMTTAVCAARIRNYKT